MLIFIMVATLAVLFAIGVVGIKLHELINLSPTSPKKLMLTVRFWVYVMVGFCGGYWLIVITDRLLPRVA